MLVHPFLLAAFPLIVALGTLGSPSTGTATTSSHTIANRKRQSNHNNRHSSAPAPVPSLIQPESLTSRQATRARIVARDTYFQQYGARKRQTSDTPFTGCADSEDRTSASTAGEYPGYKASVAAGDSLESTDTYDTSTECAVACLNDQTCNYANYETETGTCDFYNVASPDTLTAAPGFIAYVYDDGIADTCADERDLYGADAAAVCCNFHYSDTYNAPATGGGG